MTVIAMRETESVTRRVADSVAAANAGPGVEPVATQEVQEEDEADDGDNEKDGDPRED